MAGEPPSSNQSKLEYYGWEEGRGTAEERTTKEYYQEREEKLEKERLAAKEAEKGSKATVYITFGVLLAVAIAAFMFVCPVWWMDEPADTSRKLKS